MLSKNVDEIRYCFDCLVLLDKINSGLAQLVSCCIIILDGHLATNMPGHSHNTNFIRGTMEQSSLHVVPLSNAIAALLLQTLLITVLRIKELIDELYSFTGNCLFSYYYYVYSLIRHVRLLGVI